ncbi:hypothetical protein [Treponema sp. OMZ 790]|uniref:hypothetical protein n=1 Tax=Treponema sp. OMZ 790 TaxID=2563665 RepID=UPI0020A2AAD1|nr:hypothetical protein [Treponema sp. OMZ 790]
MIFMFDRQNYFCGFEFFITNEDTDPIVIYDLEIRPDDTYNSIQKKIKALKITYNLYEKEGTNPMIDMDFISKKFGKVNITIICAESGRQPVLMATALYMDLIHE